MTNRILDVVDAMDAGIACGQSYQITVMTRRESATFAGDNWQHLRPFCARQQELAFVIRRFEAERCPANNELPMKTVCGIFATRDYLEPFSANATEMAFNIDADSGTPLPPRPDLRFADAGDVFPLLSLASANPHH